MADALSTAMGWLARRDRVRRYARSLSAAPALCSDETLADFVARVTPTHSPAPWHLARLIEVLERAAYEPCRVLVSMPPRHGKSVTLLHALAWLASRFPERLNGYATYAQRFASTQSRKARRLAVDAGVRFADDANSVTEWRTVEGGGLVATGLGGPLTGIGIDGVLCVDDPIKGREQAESTTQREAAWEWFNDVAFTRLEPGSSAVVVATRWHHDDVIGRLERMGGWETINLPAVRDAEDAPCDDGLPLWPERFDLRALRAIRAQVGEYTWASLYQGHPVPRAGILFREPTRYTEPEFDGARIVLACDPAGSASTRADYTAAVALAVREQRDADGTPQWHADVLEVLRFQAETERAAAELEAFQERWGGAKLHIEASRDGKAIARALATINPRLRVAEVPALGDKFTRAQPLIAAWNHGRVRVPQRAAWLADLLAEVERFTGVADRHDDQVDALAHAFNALAAGPRRRTVTHSYDSEL